MSSRKLALASLGGIMELCRPRLMVKVGSPQISRYLRTAGERIQYWGQVSRPSYEHTDRHNIRVENGLMAHKPFDTL